MYIYIYIYIYIYMYICMIPPTPAPARGGRPGLGAPRDATGFLSFCLTLCF